MTPTAAFNALLARTQSYARSGDTLRSTLAQTRALRYKHDRDFDPNQPRDEHGRWSDGGTDSGSSAGDRETRPASPGAVDSGASADQLTGAFNSRSASDAERSRDVTQVWELDGGGRHDAEKLGITGQSFHELTNDSPGAARFHAAISAAKTGKFSAAVYVYDQQDYAGMRLFVTADDKIGFALKGDDIVSAFKNPDIKAKGAANIMLALAVQQGGRKLDAFDTVLPELYSKNGFRAATRLAWDESQKPPDWDKETFKAFNNGEPDVVFMVYDPAHVNQNGLYKKTDGIRVGNYEQAQAGQQAALNKIAAQPLMSDAEISKAISEVAKYHDFDPAAIYVDHGAPQVFELNGRRFEAGGLAHTSMIGENALVITIFAQNANPASIHGLISHEIEHIKYETAINRFEAEWAKVRNDPDTIALPGMPGEGMRPDGTLPPDLAAKYPAYAAMQAAFYRHGIMDFATSDGVSDYSFAWWKNWKDNAVGKVSSGKSAVHETLAEMARIKYDTGKFPEHMGERIISWREPDTPKPSQATIDKNAKLWRDLYRAVDTVWKLPP
jgi:hypothetical protein